MEVINEVIEKTIKVPFSSRKSFALKHTLIPTSTHKHTHSHRTHINTHNDTHLRTVVFYLPPYSNQVHCWLRICLSNERTHTRTHALTHSRTHALTHTHTVTENHPYTPYTLYIIDTAAIVRIVVSIFHSPFPIS